MILRTSHALFKLSRWQKRIIMIVLDLFLIPFSLWASYAMRLGTLSPKLADGVWLMLGAVLISIPIFIRLGLYRAVIRFLGNQALMVVFIGTSISAVSLVLITLFADLKGIPRSVFIIYWGTAFLLVGGSRYVMRRYFHAIHYANKRIHIAIYGAGHSGAELAQALSANAEHRPVLFFDDNESLQKSFVCGLKVYSPDDVQSLIERYQIEQIFLAIPTVSVTKRRDIISYLETFSVQILTIPDMSELVSGKRAVEEVREIDINDLLGREAVSPDPVLLSRCIKNKNILVTGAGGSIGSELCRQIIVTEPRRLVLFERSEFDLYKVEQELQGLIKNSLFKCELVAVLGSVTNEKRISTILRKYKINTLYHAAAYKHVPLVEHNPIEGIQNNVFGTFIAGQAALNEGVDHFVLISTDKAVRPTNVMGASKRLAELGVQALAQHSETTRFSMVRFGNVLGSSGSVIPLFREQIKRGGPVTVTHPDMVRYFMTIPEAAQLVIQAGAMSKGGEVFLLDMGEPVKILALAEQMIHLAGLSVNSEFANEGVVIEFTGLRPGEKLYEELLIDGEAQKTLHPRVYQAKEDRLSWEDYQRVLLELKDACENKSHNELYVVLKKYVSGYMPSVILSAKERSLL